MKLNKRNECILQSGQVMEYDVAIRLDSIDLVNYNMHTREYLGIGEIYSINGLECLSKYRELLHFFKDYDK